MRSPAPFPEFSYSHTRATALADCLRRYFFQYYAGHNGWRVDAPREVRITYALKQLTSVPMLLGTAVHEAALLCVACVVAGRPLPTLEALIAGGRARLNDAYVASRRRTPREFVAAPKQGGAMLAEVFYDGTLNRERAARRTRTLETCLAALHASDLWATLRAADPRDVHVVPAGQFPSFLAGGVRTFALPDLVYRPDQDAAWHLRDWKTSAEPNGGVVDQIALQGLFAREVLRLPLVGDCYVGEVDQLRRGVVDRFTITADDLEAAEADMRRSVMRMRALLADPVRNAPRGLEAFPRTDKLHRCGGCNFRHLCLPTAATAAAVS